MKLSIIKFKLSTLGVSVLFLSSLLCLMLQGDPWKIVYSSSSAPKTHLAEYPIGFSTDGKYLLVSSCSEYFEAKNSGKKSSSSRFGFRIIDPYLKEIFSAYGFHNRVLECDISEHLGLVVASEEEGATLRMYDLKSNDLRRELSVDNGKIIFLKFIGDEVIFASSRGAFFSIKSLDGPALPISPLIDGQNYEESYLSPGANMILLCSREGDSALIFEPHSGRMMKLAGTQGHVEKQSISPFSRDGKYITLCVKSKPSIVIYDTATGNRIREFGIADGCVSSGARLSSFAGNGCLVFGSTSKNGKVWNVDKSECLLSGNSIFTMSPNGERVIFWNREMGEFQMHDTYTGVHLYSFLGSSVLFHPEGNYLIVGVDDGGWGNWSYNIWLQHHSELLFNRLEFWISIISSFILLVIGANNLRKRVSIPRTPSREVQDLCREKE